MHSMTAGQSLKTCRVAFSTLFIAALIMGAACSDPPPVPFSVTFSGMSDDLPLAGIRIKVLEQTGTTDAKGELRVKLAGKQGTVIPYEVECPAGFRTEKDRGDLTLRRFVGLDPEQGGRGIIVSINCPPTQRFGVIVVRHAPNIPVMVQGQLLTRTDAAGAAHILIRGTPNTAFTVLLDTSAQPMIRPQNPATSFTLVDQDDFFVFDQAWESVAPPAKARRRVRVQRGPMLPTKLNSIHGR